MHSVGDGLKPRGYHIIIYHPHRMMGKNLKKFAKKHEMLRFYVVDRIRI